MKDFRQPRCGPDLFSLPAGRMSCLSDAGTVFFKNEADLRDGLAANAWIAGWDARTEVPVSSGARADLVLFDHDLPMIVIEIKIELLTQRALRRAFQQVDGYRLFFESGKHELPFKAVLTAVRVNWTLAMPFMAAYPNISLETISGTSKFLRDWHYARPRRTRVMQGRAREVERLAARLRQTVAVDAEAERRRFLQRHHRNYPAGAEMLARAVGLTFEPA